MKEAKVAKNQHSEERQIGAWKEFNFYGFQFYVDHT